MMRHECDDDLYSLCQDAKLERRRRAQLARHPDCLDPDHPSCSNCMDDEDEEE